MGDVEEKTGTVKSYSQIKGFGFLCDVAGLNEDVHFRRDDLPGQMFNESNLKGMQLKFSILQKSSSKEGQKFSATNLQDPKSHPTFKSVVKSWNGSKNYGFIGCPPELEQFTGDKKDIFMSARNMVDESMAQRSDLQGQTVMFSVDRGQQGLSGLYIRFPVLDGKKGTENGNGINAPAPGHEQMFQNMMSMMGNMGMVPNKTPGNNGIIGNKRSLSGNGTGLKRGGTDSFNHDTQEKRRKMAPQGRQRGHVTSFVKGKYGFLKSHKMDSEVFFLSDEDHPKGQVLEFCVVVDEKSNKFRASDLVVLEDAPNAITESEAYREWLKCVETNDNLGMRDDNCYLPETGDDDFESHAFRAAKEAIQDCSLSEIQELNIFLAQTMSSKIKEAGV